MLVIAPLEDETMTEEETIAKSSQYLKSLESRCVKSRRRRPKAAKEEGILGGISTGQDVVLRFAVKPTSSILTPRRTITKTGAETEIVTKGRHDPCVGIRAVPVAEAMVACVLLDHLLLHRGQVGGGGGAIG